MLPNSKTLERGEWGAKLSSRDNIVVLKQSFYTIIGYPTFLRPLRQILRIGKEGNTYFSHVADLCRLYNSGNNKTILDSLKCYLENAYLDPAGVLVIQDLLDCIYTDKIISFEKYRYLIKNVYELLDIVSNMEMPEKNYYLEPKLDKRNNTNIITLQDELYVLFNKLSLKGMVTLTEILCSIVYIQD